MFEQIIPILGFILIIAVVWTILRLILRLTAKIFSCGCVVILALGLLLLFVGYLEVF